MPSSSSHRSRIWLAAGAGALTAVLPLTACSEAGAPPIEAPVPIETDGPEVDGGVVAPEALVNEDVELVGVLLEYPPDGVHEEGSDADLLFALSNIGSEPVTLVDVTGPDFADATTGDGSGFEPIQASPDSNVYVGEEGAPTVTLVGLQESLRSSQSIPVTFEFEEAGEVTVEVPVAAEPNNEDPGGVSVAPTS